MPPTTTPLATSWRKKLTGAPRARARLRPSPVVLRRDQADGGADLGLAPVLVPDLRLDLQLLEARLVQGLDDVAVTLLDEAAPHLARPRQLVVVGVELLVEGHEPPDLRHPGEVPVDPPHLLAEEYQHL